MAAFPTATYHSLESMATVSQSTMIPPSSSLESSYSAYVVRVHARNGIKTLSFDSLAVYFTCTSKQASEELGISSRTLIRVCRSLGIRRWPYLSFRSEKDIERIRQEAIISLRRRLEKRGCSASPVESPNALVRRGASANRLLQLKTPEPYRPTLSPCFDGAYYAEFAEESDDAKCADEEEDFTDSCGGYSDDGGFEHTPPHSAKPQGFTFSPRRISPRKDGARVIPPLRRVLNAPFVASPQQEQSSVRAQVWSPSPCALRCPPLRSRTMSMHDILSTASSSS